MANKKITEKDLKKLAKDEGGELIENNHMIVMEGDEVVEKKYCTKCGKWHPLENFYKNYAAPDKLGYYCKDCSKERAKDKKVDTPPAVAVKEVVVEKVVEVEKPMTANDALSVLIADFEAKAKEIEMLKAELEKCKDSKKLDNLTEKDLKYVLENNRVAPRLLVEALTRYDDRYVFSAYDKVTGLTSTIKVEPHTA